MDITFQRLSEGDLEMVLRWRTRPDITEWLFTDIQNDIDLQKKWFDTVKNDNTQCYWIIRLNGSAIGLLFLKDIDKSQGAAEFGYYLADDTFKGLTAMVAPAFYWWAFTHGFKKFIIHIFADHKRLIMLHMLHGYQLTGILPDHAKGRLVYKMELDKDHYRGARILPRLIEI